MQTFRTLIALTVGLNLAAWAMAAEPSAPPKRPTLPVATASSKVIEGPGFRIERLATRANKTAVAPAPTRVLDRGPVTQTVVCRAGENLLISGIRMTASGSGIVAQRGCRLRIVDSHIEAAGVALIVEPGADVELQNSVFTGRNGSVEAAPNARLAALGASFAGPATLAGADFLDRGGNLWGSAP